MAAQKMRLLLLQLLSTTKVGLLQMQMMNDAMEDGLPLTMSS